MNKKEIIDTISFYPYKPIPEVFEEAVKKNMVSELVGCLKYAKKTSPLPDGYIGHTLAMFILAQKRAKSAYKPLIELLTFEEEPPLLFSDELTENMHMILASICKGDTSHIKKLIENPTVCVFCRIAALESLFVLFKENELDRKTLIDYFSYLFKEGLEREADLSYADSILNWAVWVVMKIYPKELFSQIRQIYKSGHIDFIYGESDTYGPKKLKADIKKGEKAILKKRFPKEDYHFIVDAWGEVKHWGIFDPKEKDRFSKKNLFLISKKNKFC